MDKNVKVETEDRLTFAVVRPDRSAWYCVECHVLHVCSDTCPETGRTRGDDDG